MTGNHKLFTKAGYSLLELLVAVTIGGVGLGAVTTTFQSQSRSYHAQEQINEMHQNVRTAMEMIGREVRMAGYLIQPGAVCSPGIPYSNQQLQIRADLGPPYDGLCDGTNEDIVYRYNTPGDKILRNGAVLAENIGGFGIPGFTFAYLDSIGNATNDPAEIRQIEITITGRTARSDPSFPANGGYRTYTLKSVITPRNL